MPTLRPLPEIAIGRDRIDGIAEDCDRLVPGARALLVVTDGGVRRAGLLDRLLSALGRRADAAHVFDGIDGEPGAHQVDAAAAVARDRGAGLVIGIGGGSALDVAKMAAAMAPGDSRAEDHRFAAQPFPDRPLPAICVPTTAGTGSEVTTTAVFTLSSGRKAWAWAPELMAAKAILDPTLLVTLPPHLTAATGIDALVHAVEAATNRNRFAANDIACHAAIRLVCRHLPAAVAEPGDLAAREGLLLAACLAGMGINNAGTAIAHTVAHALGSLGKVHHGRAAGIGLLASLPASLAGAPEAFAAVAEAMGGPREAAALPGLVADLCAACRLELGLARDFAGLAPERLAREMAAPENATMRASAARPWREEDLLVLARAVLAIG